MRLNKYISDTGACSRREADRLIAEGRVQVNGIRARVGAEVGEGDTVLVDGEALRARAAAPGKRKHVYIALHKPVGITSTTEMDVKDNIIEFIGHQERIFPIGRLDKDSEGLILLTNNGDIVNEILREENAHEKEYVVTVDRPVTDDFLFGMANGVDILDTRTKPCKVRRIGRNIFGIILTQGLNRQIRRMCAAFDYKVRRLQRVRIVNIRIDGIKTGQWRNLTRDELRGLLPHRTQW